MEFGVKEELIDLMEYFAPHLNRNRARLSIMSGFSTITAITNTDPVELYKATKIPLEKIIEMLTLRGQTKSHEKGFDGL